MEEESKMETPSSDKGVWSPDILYSNHPHSNGTGMTSTPYWPLSYKELNESEGSSKQDSGYCSATPRSADSGGLLYDKCRQCNKSLHLSYARSTPDYVCSCEKLCIDGSSPNLGCMEAIQEVNMSPTPKLPSRVRLNRPLELYEDVMDTSLYPEEMEVDHCSSVVNHQCSLDFSELGEEKSIDFMEPHVFSAFQSTAKESPLNCLQSNISSDVNFEAGNSQDSGKQEECKFIKVNSEDFFSPEIFNCDLVSPKIKNESTPAKISPKIKNESTPAKFKKATPPTKMKKSSFQSSVKKVATMNRVLRSFYSLNGIESVDFLYQLGEKRNFQHIVSRILNFLPEKDLDTVRVVSKTWNKLLNNDYTAFNRWQLHCTAMRLMKENLLSPVKQGGSGGRNRPALTRLQNVANQTSPPRQPFSPQQPALSPPVSPGSTRFHSYQRAARTLKKNERLLPCPKCRFPSTDRGSPVLQCPRSGCRHRFCVWCSIEVLPGLQHNCPPLYTPRCLMRKNTVHSAGSKTSKRNLRRL